MEKIKGINEHEGNKYLRNIQSALNKQSIQVSIQVDVYAVLVAFGVTCPARQQAIKKLLCAGLRGKGNEMDDLIGALAAVNRAVELQGAVKEKSLNEDVEVVAPVDNFVVIKVKILEEIIQKITEMTGKPVALSEVSGLIAEILKENVRFKTWKWWSE